MSRATQWMDELGCAFSQSYGNINVPETSLCRKLEELDELRAELTRLKSELAEALKDKARMETLVKLGSFHVELNRVGRPHLMVDDKVLGIGNNLREAIDEAVKKL